MFTVWPGGQAPPLHQDFEQRWVTLIAERELVRHGVWAYHDGAMPLPRQGWKIHVSAIPSNAERVLQAVHEKALEIGFSYKVYSSLRAYLDASSALGVNYSQKGKLIAIYPADYREFMRILASVGTALEGTEHYSIPFEPNIPDTPLYYRYGCIAGNALKLISPSGKLVPDDRTKHIPDFVTDPLEDHSAPASASRPLDSVHVALSEQYRIERALSQRGRGGNYLATGTNDGRRYFIKEGRRYAEHDEYGRTGKSRLENERDFLLRLSGAGLRALAPVATFGNRDFCYIVYPFLELDDPCKLELSRKSVIAYTMIDLVASAHRLGVILGDVKLENFLVSDGQAYLCDLETARDSTWEDTVGAETREYLPRTVNIRGFRRDRYSLAITICFLFSQSPPKRFSPGVRIGDLLAAVPDDLRATIKPWLRI
jgi:hypothetical protein